MAAHHFGGPWTQDKLERLAQYLVAYTRIFKANEGARFFTTTYVDAFAGTGFRDTVSGSTEPRMFDEADVREFQRGSTKVALDTDPPFHRYIFVDKNPKHVAELHTLAASYPDRNITIERDDANAFLARWCRTTDGSSNRAVVFLDPYGTQVEWSTIEQIAATKGIDLWILFPLGQAVNRMVTKNEPTPAWSAQLDRIFGTDAWKTEFYRTKRQGSLFEDTTTLEKIADFDAIGRFFVSRLGTIFAGVSKNALPLLNSKNVPIYLLCFAAANAKGARTAIKIANHILRR